MATQTVNEEKLDAFMNQLVSELGATVGAALVVTGDRLGLGKAMAGASGVTARDLAERTGTSERYIHEWLCAQAAGGYVDYDPTTRHFALPPEHALALADESSPFFACGAFQRTATNRSETGDHSAAGKGRTIRAIRRPCSRAIRRWTPSGVGIGGRFLHLAQAIVPVRACPVFRLECVASRACGRRPRWRGYAAVRALRTPTWACPRMQPRRGPELPRGLGRRTPRPRGLRSR